MNKTFLFSYVPSRFENVSEEERTVRKLVYNFKDGDYRASRYVAWLVVNELQRLYDVVPSNLVLACVPASNFNKYQKRFAHFSKLVAAELHIENAFKHVSILGIRDSKHNRKDHTVRDLFSYRVLLDEHFFEDKEVVIFDDVFTTGASASEFKDDLEACGAYVSNGIFLAETTNGLPFNIKSVDIDKFYIEPVPGTIVSEFLENIDYVVNKFYL